MSTNSKTLSRQIDTVRLKNGLGLLTLELPSRLDTFLTWTHKSDCATCGYEKYRFQQKIYPIFLESGFYWIGDPKDSVDEITIFHQVEIFPIDTTFEITRSDNEFIVEEYSKDPRYYPIGMDTLISLDSKMYSVIYSDHFDSTTMAYRKSLIAQTVVRGSDVRIILRRWSREPIRSDYFDEAFSILKSMKFSKGH
jgi:hypothetical protein